MQQKRLTAAIAVALLAAAGGTTVQAAPVTGGTLDPTTIPKYVTPLVIPPVMKNTGPAEDYDIAVRQFQQQILPGGIWATLPGCVSANCTFPATTVWSYGPDADPTPAVAPAANSQFNYPAYTIEATKDTTITVDWINQLVANPDACKTSTTPTTDLACNFIPHILPVDRSLHWANPEQLPCTAATGGVPTPGTDCRPDAVTNGSLLQQPYAGPVPIITHVHGAHVTPESDGYPEAWWLADANNIPAGYATQGRLVNKYPTQTNSSPGVGSFTYSNDQPSSTLWYHDHSLGMTRNNVYAGPAGFWLLRESGGGETGLLSGTLPGPAPAAGQAVLDLNVPGNAVRAAIREIPIVIQDRSFNADGSLYYPDNRAFFQEVKVNQLNIPFIGDPAGRSSDIAPIWNPEAFFNVMVVNGVSWPTLEVEPDLYRFRLLNGCNSRFLNLSLQALDAAGAVLGEVPFYQIGAEQSLLPQVVKVSTGFKTRLPGDGTIPADTPAQAAEEAMLVGLAERADVIVDFSNLPANTVKVRMVNTAPDAPFGGFPDVPADPATTGQVMEFALVADTAAGEGFTAPESLQLSLPDAADPANSAGTIGTARDMALIEEESLSVCVKVAPNGQINYDKHSTPDPLNPGTCVSNKNGKVARSVPMAPKAAVLGTNGKAGGTVTLWSDPIATIPALGATETWEIWNHTVDAHPIHLHLVKYKLVNREAFDPATFALSGAPRSPTATEMGWKDTMISYPAEVTRVNATFDIEGLYVWHCHIVEHEDNEMMVPFCVGDDATTNSACAVANASLGQ